MTRARLISPRLHVAVVLAVALLAPACARDGERPSLRERLAERAASRSIGEQTGDPATPGLHSFSLTHGGIEREYLVHVPRSHDPRRPSALVVSLHGGGGTMQIQANDRYFGLVAKAEAAGYIAVFPNGYSRLPSGRLATWNAGSCCGPAVERDIDDVGFIRAMMREITTRYNIDRDRVFANGFSNGAMFAYRLACEMADTFRAIAPVAGTEGVPECRPSRPVSVLHVHALDDDRVLFNGGAGVSSRTKVNFVSVQDTVTRWVRRNRCNPTPRRVLERPGAYCDAYAGCDGASRVMLCVTERGGHAWPGGVKVMTGSPGSTALSATDLSWDFFNGR